MAYEFQETIDTADAMRELMGQPSQLVIDKATNHLDQHSRAFITRSPFLIVASSDEKGNVDASPKGDEARPFRAPRIHFVLSQAFDLG